MFLAILIMTGMLSPPQNPQLAAHIRELTHEMLLSRADAEDIRINKQVREIYMRYGLSSISQVGDEAAYDFVFLLMGQPRSFQTEILTKVDEAGVASELPEDAVTFFKKRLRLNEAKETSDSTTPTNLSLRNEITKLYRTDQLVRQKEGFDPKRLAETDENHAEQLQAIVKTHGVPTYAMVGAEAAGQFIIMIQHQSPRLREQVLPMLKKNVEQGQADPESYALVYDLSQVDQGNKQYFGERLVCHSGQLHEAPIEDAEHVNQRRAGIGLMRIELYTYLITHTMPQMCSTRL